MKQLNLLGKPRRRVERLNLLGEPLRRGGVPRVNLLGEPWKSPYERRMQRRVEEMRRLKDQTEGT